MSTLPTLLMTYYTKRFDGHYLYSRKNAFILSMNLMNEALYCIINQHIPVRACIEC